MYQVSVAPDGSGDLVTYYVKHNKLLEEYLGDIYYGIADIKVESTNLFDESDTQYIRICVYANDSYPGLREFTSILNDYLIHYDDEIKAEREIESESDHEDMDDDTDQESDNEEEEEVDDDEDNDDEEDSESDNEEPENWAHDIY